jgi:hypothetical protein
MLVIHQPRVAWDTARIVVEAANDPEFFGWLSRQLGELFGPAVEADLADRLAALTAAARPRMRAAATLS